MLVGNKNIDEYSPVSKMYIPLPNFSTYQFSFKLKAQSTPYIMLPLQVGYIANPLGVGKQNLSDR